MAVPPDLECTDPGTRVRGNPTKMHCKWSAGVIASPMGRDLAQISTAYGRPAVLVQWDNGPLFIEFVESLQPE